MPLMARTGPYNLAFRKRGHGPRCGGGAAFDPGFGFFNFVSTGLAAPTTCLNYYLSSICNSLPLSTNFRGGSLPLSTNFRGGKSTP